MRTKKVLIGFLVTTLLVLSAATAFAADIEERGLFGAFTGTVKKIENHRALEGSKIILVEDEEKRLANFIVSPDTYIVNDAEIKEGEVITGYFRTDVPMIMIYPPQYSAKVVVVEGEEKNIKVDKFDKELVSSDKSLKLNISEATEIIFKNGKPFTGELQKKELVVFYDVVRESFPAQTTPTKVVVLSEEEIETSLYDVSTMEIIVENEKIEAPAAYTNEKGIAMVPLRKIAENLGYVVSWDEKLQRVTVGDNITLKIGEDNYGYKKLGTAPEIKEGTTYVPLSFFKKVLGINNAYVHEAQIVIDNGELME